MVEEYCETAEIVSKAALLILIGDFRYDRDGEYCVS